MFKYNEKSISEVLDDFNKALNAAYGIYNKEEKLMRVTISMPMNGKSHDQIKRERENTIEKIKNMHMEFVDNIIETTADPDIYYHPVLYYIAESIDIIATCDAVYFMPGWQESRGCVIERQICEAYGVKILDYPFFEYLEQKEVKYYED